MKKRVAIFFLLLILSISLSSALKTLTVDETELVSLKPKATDEDEDKLFYFFSEPLDEQGKWQTTYGDAGEYTITVTASDGELDTSKDVLLIIKKRNIAPTIDSLTPEETQPSVDEGGSIDFNVEASDLNKDELTYQWELNDKIVSEEETYTYNPDYSDAGQYKVNLLISDGEEEQENEWLLTVNEVDRAELFDSINGITVYEQEIVELSLPDFEKYKLEYTISEPIGDDNHWQTGYDDAGTYTSIITIKDGEFSASKAVEIVVIDQDRPLTFKPIANAWLKENQKVTIELEANDPDNEEIEFSADKTFPGSSLKGNKFEWITNYDTVKKENALDKTLDKFHLLYKPFEITFTAKSEQQEITQSVLIIVKDVNRQPVLSDIQEIIVNEGEEVIIEPEAYDEDGDEITYSYSGWIDLERYTTNYDDAGTYKVKVTASDGFLSDEKYVTIIVNDVNRPPTLNEIEAIEINENEKLELPLYTHDPEGDSIEISSDSLPANSTIEDNIFIWTPDYNTLISHSYIFTIDFKASDGKAETTKQANVTVYNVNRPPKITAASKKSLTVKKGRKVKFEIVAEDKDNQELTYTWKFGLLEQHTAGPAIIRTFTSEGNKKVKVIVSDGEEEAKYVFNVKVV